MLYEDSPLWQPFKAFVSDVRSAQEDLIKTENRALVRQINTVLHDAMGGVSGTRVGPSYPRILRNAGIVANHTIGYRTVDEDTAIAAMRKGRALLVEHGLA